MNVHILVTCRNPDLWRASTLVFDTIRVGFPDAEIVIWPNGQSLRGKLGFIQKIQGPARLALEVSLIHHEWIQRLIETQQEPFIICDTDMIFWDRIPIERFTAGGNALAGRFIPCFYDKMYTQCVTQARLHTSLLYIDPVVVRKDVEDYYKQFPSSPFGNMRPNLICGAVNPVLELGGITNYFHDTCSMLYQVCDGMHFDEAILNCYDHLNCATYIDLLEPKATVSRRLALSQKKIFDNPALAKGIWKKQDEYYAKHAR